MQSAPEKRRFWRAAFTAPAHLMAAGQDTVVGVIDLSLQGALIETPPGWQGETGSHYTLRIDLGEAVAIEIAGTIVHLQGNRLGLHCDRIDLDSITHLRRLVELNAGDAALLEREMSHLLAAD